MRTEDRRYRDEWLPNFYPSREVTPGQWLRVSRTGKTTVLPAAEDRQLSDVFMGAELFDRLERTGHILTPANSQRIFTELKTWQRRYYAGPELHIAVLTQRCNLACSYCHMNPVSAGASRDAFDMTLDTARAVVTFAMCSPSPRINFEFQGGEPFLNFAALQAIVEHANELNREAGKELSFSVVTNLLTARDDQLAFCAEHGVRVSYTLNGPQAIHDHYRKTDRGAGTFAGVMRRLRQVQTRFPGLVTATPLCVIDEHTAPELDRMIDFYYDEGFDGLALIRMKPLGFARRAELKFDITQFMRSYLSGLDYILDKNRRTGRAFRERMIPVVLAKVLGEADTGFVDWRNPCGDVSGALVYDHDGEILPTDEARSMREVFGLGRVQKTTYDALMRKEGTFRTMNLSLRDRDPGCRECAYNPYCGVMPVLEYARSGEMEPRAHVSEDCTFTLSLLDWVFRQMLEHPLPLMLMIPSMGRHVGKLLDQTGPAMGLHGRNPGAAVAL